ncbi:MAG TPA: PAS domain S-box protein [Candidatus Dormibacteraeota bacterium]|nr:PAS domain S-box protein [Candidatus Dormibacteraeota bacterium]
MQFSLSQTVRAGIGLALLVAAIAGASAYMSGHGIEVHISSRIGTLITMFGLPVILVVLTVYSIIVTREIAKRKRAEETFRGLPEAAPDVMLVVNQGGKAVLLNFQAEKRFGYHRDELVEQTAI